jgi:hypothetical protein
MSTDHGQPSPCRQGRSITGSTGRGAGQSVPPMMVNLCAFRPSDPLDGLTPDSAGWVLDSFTVARTERPVRLAEADGRGCGARNRQHRAKRSTQSKSVNCAASDRTNQMMLVDSDGKQFPRGAIARGAAELQQRSRLDLADPLARQLEAVAHLVEGGAPPRSKRRIRRSRSSSRPSRWSSLAFRTRWRFRPDRTNSWRAGGILLIVYDGGLW